MPAVPSRDPDSAQHVPALDGLRGLAILLVLWAHFGPDLLPGARSGFALTLHNLLGAGWAGVDLFFVLSGFLITGVLLDAKPEPSPDPSRSDVPDQAPASAVRRAAAFFGRFYARRALRIFPLYYGVLLAVAAFTAGGGSEDDRRAWREWAPWLWAYAGNVFNARHGWRAGPCGLLLNHFWTLAVEEQFYLVWPVLVYACGRRSLRDGCLGLIGLAAGLRFYYSAFGGNGYAATLLMPCRADAFAAGALVALAVRGPGVWPSPDGPDCRGTPAARRRLARAGGWTAGAAGLLLLPTFGSFQWVDVLGRTLLAALFAGVLLLALCTPLRRPLRCRLLRGFGKYSYGLYVLHFLFYRPIDRCFPAARFGALGRFVGCTAVSLALAWCSWHLIEKRFLSLKRLFPLHGRPALPAAASATPRGEPLRAL